MRSKRRDTAQRLRSAVEALPRHTKEGMLHGIQRNPRIIVGAYVDKRGGVCPMLAAHRNGGRTNFGSFARAWDAYTGAKSPRRASAREVRTLKGYLEVALIRDGIAPPQLERDAGWAERPLADEVREVQATRRRLAAAEAHDAADVTIEELFAQAEAAAVEKRAEDRARELLGEPGSAPEAASGDLARNSERR